MPKNQYRLERSDWHELQSKWPRQNGPESEQPPFGQNGPKNWSNRPHIPKMKVKTAPRQNSPIFFSKCIDKQTDNLNSV